MRLEYCTGLNAGLVVPTPRVRAVVPVDFVPVELVAGVSPVKLEAFSCERAALPGAVVEHYMELTIAPKVDPVEASWGSTNAASFFLLERMSSSPQVVQYYQSLGLPGMNASFSVVPLPGPHAVDRWKVVQGDNAFEFEVTRASRESSAGNFTTFQWAGAGPYVRATVDLTFSDDILEAGALRVMGNGLTSQMLAGPVGVWDGQPILRQDSVVKVESRFFGS